MLETRIHAAKQKCCLRSTILLTLAGLVGTSCESRKNQAPSPVVAASVPSPLLAATRVDLAEIRPADEALVLLVSALRVDPQSQEANDQAEKLLLKIRWSLPETLIEHGQTIDQIRTPSEKHLWVSLGGKTNTTLRWNLESLEIETCLFPMVGEETIATRSLIIAPPQNSIVVERAGVLLMCSGETMKPIRDLGSIPDEFAPSSVMVYSPDGLLIAHPTSVSKTDPSIVWVLRDTATGEIIRKSEPSNDDSVRSLAAILDRRNLRVLRANGSIMVMPVSPAEAISIEPPAEPISIEQAVFSSNGGSALIQKNQGAHRPSELWILPTGGEEDSSLEPQVLFDRFPWGLQPGIWTTMLRDPESSRLKVDGRIASILTGDHSPIRSAGRITALSVSGGRIFIGDEHGNLTIHRSLPLPQPIEADSPMIRPTENHLTALQHLSQALTGLSYDETQGIFNELETGKRLTAFKNCDWKAVAEVFPKLDFSPLIEGVKNFQSRNPASDALRPLHDRYARAGLAKAESKKPVSLEEIETALAECKPEDLPALVASKGKSGPAAARTLEVALNSTHPEWIDACLANAANLPPLIHRLATSRIAWLQDRKADAIMGWPDVFPDLKHVRAREDWDGWEMADYSQALEKLRLCVSEELTALEVPEQSTPEQRKAVVDRLTDPLTVKSVGKARYAKACLKAALALSEFKEENANTFRLALIARNLGESPARCLRAEAISLTALGEYQQAHERWISLITEHPIENQEPGDYAEAAYTAFENANPQQAMAILTTGLHRFPNDANFALRAGWVALLTGNAERAYRFLLTGRQIGYPEEKTENAIALMAIAAAQTGAAEDAAVFYQDLIDLDPAWENPETIETLEWPEELKSTLRQLVW